MKPTADLVKIVSYGGGVIINAAAFATDDLVQIVSYAKKDQGPAVIMRGAKSKSTDDLVKIASYGSGHVIFDLSE